MECPQARHSRFVELWTLKESFVKAIGKGIAAAPLSGFSFDLRPQPELARTLQTVAGLQSAPNPLQIGLSLHDNSMPGEGKKLKVTLRWRPPTSQSGKLTPCSGMSPLAGTPQPWDALRKLDERRIFLLPANSLARRSPDDKNNEKGRLRNQELTCGDSTCQRSKWML
ncbi:Holo-ACP synthase [Klebsormidium nitens]|uniref:Holo-ACP synthase n=1 Tax=Klebsormidium nitens TaxID=105231 RepID=A0A1Y1IW67_KLENI|nr:Holo-ACP synthase [Klebsormidium nitens]|eukprot:GAQ92518.1 Holo-ACP synthase [Klebsormidium nitens]